MGGIMRLKNKKTGEIIEHALLSSYGISGDVAIEFMDENAENGYSEYARYHSLAGLNAEWEDAPEEPKEYWYIGNAGEVYGFSDYYLGTEIEESHREIGNLFESKEEAEKAVEKLKAWKRLKDKGVRLDAVVDNFFCLDVYMSGEPYEAIKDDLKIVFGGEE